MAFFSFSFSFLQNIQIFNQIKIKSTYLLKLLMRYSYCYKAKTHLNVIMRKVQQYYNYPSKYYLSFYSPKFFRVSLIYSPEPFQNYDKSTMTNQTQLFKNMTCLFFCLVMIFITSIFVSETYYNQIINDQIDQVSLLKSISYEDWALKKTDSTVIHKFKPYVYDLNGQSTLLNQTTQYQYTYQYKNTSFTQGNTGNIRYLNTWKRELLHQQQQNLNSEQIRLQTQSPNDNQLYFFNVDAEKIYNYDYFSPVIRRFALTYNIVFTMLSKDFLPNFYGYYMFQFMFKDQKMVQSRLFEPLNISEEKGKSIYSNSLYGFSNPLNIASWLKLGDQIATKSHYSSQFFKGALQDLELTESQILYLADSKSTLQSLLIAIKSALKYKLKDIDGDLCEDELCSIEELVASQISMGFLTKQSIFASTNINKLVNQLNGTIYNPIQYSQFCKIRPHLQCAQDINAMNFFKKNFLSNYTEVDYIFKNFQNPKAIEEKYDMNNTGPALIQYIKYLYTDVFNLAKVSQSSQKGASNINVEAFKRSFTNYNHIQPIMDSFKELLYLELHTRAFYNKFINKTQTPKCEDYYSGEFTKYKADCQKILLNSTSSVRVYMKAYLNVDSLQIMKYTTMDSKVLFDFLHSDASLFAQQAKQLDTDLKAHYGCKFTCNQNQLIVKQWKDGSVMSNLPTEAKYFVKKSESILAWDQKNILKGVQPQIFKFTTIPSDFDAGAVLNNIFGVYSLFNLMKVYNDPEGSLYKGLLNSDLLYYIQSLVIQVDFNGLYMQKSNQQFFNGYESELVNQKRRMNDSLGGASWLDPQISIIKLENKPQKFNFINSGIYNSQKLRTLSLIEDSLYSSSDYQIFKSEFEDVQATFTSDKKVKGTNLFGFQTKIEQFDSIQGYFQMIYQSQPLSYKQSLTWKNLKDEQIEAFRFQFQSNKQFQVSVEELANRTVELNSDSYFIVEPQTGLTLEMYIKYTVYSQPFYYEFLQKNKTEKLPLYQGEVFFVNDKTDDIVELNKNKRTLSLLFLLGIIFSSISIVCFVVMLVLYKRASKSNKSQSQKSSLLNSQSNVSSTLD